MKATLGTRVRSEFLCEAVKQHAAERNHAEMALESGIAKEKRERLPSNGCS
jgi:hypothetical protein